MGFRGAWRALWARPDGGSTPTNVSLTSPEALRALGVPSLAGVEVTERTVVGISAFYRGCSLIAGTLAGLPLRTLRDVEGVRTRVSSLFDNPGGAVGMIPFAWTETQVWHQLMHGDAFLFHLYNGAGVLAALKPIHPGCVEVDWDAGAVGGKLYKFRDDKGKRHEVDATGMTQVMGPSLDGLRGMSVLTIARTSLGGAIAGDQAAARMFRDGALMSGVFVPDDDLGDDEMKTAKAAINDAVSGSENAGKIAVLNRNGTLSPWSMSATDAQFIESRQFSVEEVARWLGVPPHLLMQTDKQTSWGTGVSEQNRGLGRFTLLPWAQRMEQTYTTVIKGERFVEYDFAGLERGSPEQEIALLLSQVNAGVMSVEQYCKIRNMPAPNPSETYVTGPFAKPNPAGASPAANALDALRVSATVGNPTRELIGATP